MTKLTPIKERAIANLDVLPRRSDAERLEELERELMTVAALLRSAELRGQLCPAEAVERAKLALTAATPDACNGLEAACRPASLAELGECIAGLIQSIPQGDPADGYKAALTMDVGSVQPSRGALEAGCRRLRTTSMFRPKIPEVLEAVREAGVMYEAALRAIDEFAWADRPRRARPQAEPSLKGANELIGSLCRPVPPPAQHQSAIAQHERLTGPPHMRRPPGAQDQPSKGWP